MTLESNQRVTEAMDRLRTVRVCATNFVSKAAAHISNRGKDTGLIGATLHFIISKRTLTLSVLLRLMLLLRFFSVFESMYLNNLLGDRRLSCAVKDAVHWEVPDNLEEG